ncbi:MAG: FeS assembly SUF system protein [Bacteroidetes bacterium]|nr:MAG: FeS assembly SUF system protein [Bacteroidota bacterium]
MSKKETEKKIIEQLKMVFDPEIPVNIYDIGLIYEINVLEEGKVHIVMTLTSPNCPVAESLPLEAKYKAEEVEEVKEVEIELTFEPPWDMEMLTDEAKLELGMM